MSESSRWGNAILLLSFVLVLSFDLIIAIGPGGSEADFLRIFLAAALMFCVWLGQRWAMVIYGIILGLVGMSALISGTYDRNVILSLLGIVYVSATASLFVPPVQDFLREQRSGRRPPRENVEMTAKDNAALQFLSQESSETEDGPKDPAASA
jgi:hypothetical protein